MAYKNLLYQKKDGIARITINRPEVMNAWNIETITEIKQAVQEAHKDDEVRVVVLTGGEKVFSTGLDLKSVEGKILEGGMASPELVNPFLDLIDTMQFSSKVVIAMVRGYCLTGALELVMGLCDLIVAAEDAKFGDTHTRWGLCPSWGMSQRLPRLVGVLKAKELSFTADLITAEEAERIGLINKVVAANKLEETVQELARKILANSREAIAAYKYLYNYGMGGTLREGLKFEVKTKFPITDTEERLNKFRKKR